MNEWRKMDAMSCPWCQKLINFFYGVTEDCPECRQPIRAIADESEDAPAYFLHRDYREPKEGDFLT